MDTLGLLLLLAPMIGGTVYGWHRERRYNVGKSAPPVSSWKSPWRSVLWMLALNASLVVAQGIGIVPLYVLHAENLSLGQSIPPAVLIAAADTIAWAACGWCLSAIFREFRNQISNRNRT